MTASLLTLLTAYALLLTAPAPATQGKSFTLGTSGTAFTIDGEPRFLVLISDFDALDARDVDRDFEYLSSRVDGVRIFGTWWDFGPGRCPLRFSPGTVIAVDAQGKGVVRPDRLKRLEAVLDAAGRHGLVVDLSFAAETVQGLSTMSAGPDGGVCKPSGRANRVKWDEYARAMGDLTRALKGPRFAHVFFDLQNEWGHPVNGATEADLKRVVDAVTAADPDRLLTISSFDTNGPKRAGIIERLGLDALNFHDFPRGRGWASRTAQQVTEFRQALDARGLKLPIYDGEPDPSSYGTGIEAFETSLAGAKKSGAAAWTFHTRAGHQLESKGLVDALEPDAKRFLDRVRAIAGPRVPPRSSRE